MLTSSFTGWTNYMMDVGQLLQDSAAMKNFGATMVLWDLKAMKPEQGLLRARRAARNPLGARRPAPIGR